MAGQASKRVLTIGYDGKAPDELTATLSDHDVERVIDVRAVGESSVEGFSSDELAETLASADIGYTHLGQLGDFQPEPYPRYMETDAFEDAYGELLELAEEGHACLLCRCADVSTCHRRFLARKLRDEGLPVVHLTPAGPREAVTFDGGT